MKQNNQRRKYPIYHLATIDQQQQSMKDDKEPSQTHETENDKTKRVQVPAGGSYLGGSTNNKDVLPLQTGKQPGQCSQRGNQSPLSSFSSFSNLRPTNNDHGRGCQCFLCYPQDSVHFFDSFQPSGALPIQSHNINGSLVNLNPANGDDPNPANGDDPNPALNTKLTKKQLGQLLIEQQRTKRSNNQRRFRQLQHCLEKEVFRKQGSEALLKLIQSRNQNKDERERRQDDGENGGRKPPQRYTQFTREHKQLLLEQLIEFGHRANQLTPKEVQQLWIYGKAPAKRYFYKKYIRDILPRKWEWLPKDLMKKYRAEIMQMSQKCQNSEEKMKKTQKQEEQKNISKYDLRTREERKLKK